MEILNLKDRDWLPFPLNSVFVIKAGKRLTKADMSRGKRPFIGATDSNNGITNFVSNTNTSLDKDVLGVNYNGSVVETFYHPYECVFSDDVKRLRIKDAPISSRFVYLFLKTAIVQQKEKYAYGYKFNEQRMNKQSILLPVVDAGASEPVPDWRFMNDYIAEREQSFVARYSDHIGSLLKAEDASSQAHKQKEWREFSLSCVFDIASTSSSIDKINLIKDKGDYPYITRTERNNGVDSFVCEQANYARDKGNCITVGLDTQTAFYQPNEFYTGQNIQVLRNEHLNTYTANFILPLLRNLLTIFNWGSSGATLTRLRRSKIMLPVDDNKQPDWDYMEKYAKMVAKHRIHDYLGYKKKVQSLSR